MPYSKIAIWGLISRAMIADIGANSYCDPHQRDHIWLRYTIAYSEIIALLHYNHLYGAITKATHVHARW